LRAVTGRELDLLAQFQKTPQFFSSPALLAFFASSGHQTPQLPEGQTDAERRGRIFFDDANASAHRYYRLITPKR